MTGDVVQTLPFGVRVNTGCVFFLRQEEMYIFMEYCDEGTLEEVSRLGLQEHVIRLYSKQITIAINVLHEHGIVHRDIKGNPPLTWLPWSPDCAPPHGVDAARTHDPTPTCPFSTKKRCYCECASIKNPVWTGRVGHTSPSMSRRLCLSA